LPFSPASFVMLLYESLRRVLSALLVVDAVAETEFMSSGEVQETTLPVFKEIFSCLSLAIIRFKAPSLTRESYDYTTSAVIEKVDNAVMVLKSFLPLADGPQVSTIEANGTDKGTESVWQSWRSMWKKIGPTMNAVISTRNPDNRKVSSFTTIPPFMFRTDTNREVTARDTSNLDPERRKENLIAAAGAGYGVLLWEFISASVNFTPIVICAVNTVECDDSTFISVIERCADCWLYEGNNLHALIAASSHQVEASAEKYELSKIENRKRISALQLKSFKDGAWNSCYIFVVGGISHGIVEAESFLNLAKWLSSKQAKFTRFQSTEEAPLKLVPLWCLFFDLALASETRKDLGDPFVIEQLRKVVKEMTPLRSSDNGISTATKHILNKMVEYIPTGDSSQRREESSVEIMTYSLASFVYLHTTKLSFRIGSHEADRSLIPLNMSLETDAYLSALQKMSEVSPEAGWAHKYVMDPENNITNLNEFVNELSSRLYPQLPWLRRDRNDYLYYDSNYKGQGTSL